MILTGYLVVGLSLAWGFFTFTVDDTFISLRYSENLARGLGPVFNPGERVEGFSNPLWVALMGILALLPGDLFLPSKLASSLCYLAGGWILLRHIIRSGQDPLLAAFLYLASTPLVIWGVSGMETALYGGLLLLWSMAIAEDEPRPGRVLLIATLLLLCRPEAPLPIGIGFAALLWRRRLAFRTAGTFLVIVACLLALRQAYYGDILPNTYYAKHYQTPGRWHITLWNYVRGFYLGPGLLPLIGVLAFLRKFPDRAGASLAALALWPALFCTLVGGDWMPWWRFMVPTLPISIWLASRAFHAWTASSRPEVRRRWMGVPMAVHAAAVALAIGTRVPFDLSPPTTDVLHRSVGNGNANYRKAVRALPTLAPDLRNLAVGELGYFCYYVPVPCLDLHGLTDPRIARSREYPNTVIGKVLPLGDEDFPRSDLGRYLFSRRPDVWLLSREETDGEKESLFGGAFFRIAIIGNFQVFRAAPPPAP